jgi:hypothetical protein
LRNGPASSFHELNSAHIPGDGCAISGSHFGRGEERVIIGLVHGFIPAALEHSKFLAKVGKLNAPGARYRCQ